MRICTDDTGIVRGAHSRDRYGEGRSPFCAVTANVTIPG
jgi:hypothetical protein